jgi:hypothetical protein
MINTSVPISILLDGVRQAYIDEQKKKGIRYVPKKK